MNEIVSYPAPTARVAVRFDRETVWLTQKQMADLFGCNVPNINKHLDRIFASGELSEASTVSKMEIVAEDGKTREVAHYNLDAIISVGYRVNSRQGVKFRQWATGVLRERLLAAIGAASGRRTVSASLTYGADDAGDDPAAVRGVLEGNLRRVLRLHDLAGVAAFVEETLAEEWLRPLRCTGSDVRRMERDGRLDCLVHNYATFPSTPNNPIRMRGLFYVESRAVQHAVFTNTAMVHIVARDRFTGKEGHMPYSVPWRRVVGVDLPPMWAMVFHAAQICKAKA